MTDGNVPDGVGPAAAGYAVPSGAGAPGSGHLGPVTRELLAGPVLEVAPLLLGAELRLGPVTVRLTEVEAYAGQQDPGSHAFRGPTPRTQVMFGPAGHLYIYFSYGMHWACNVVCGPEGQAAAVLLRAGEVVSGEAEARTRRDAGKRRPVSHRDLARGPARLAQALGLTGEFDGVDLVGSSAGGGGQVGPELRVPAGAPVLVETGPRVGVSGEGGDGSLYPWRFWMEGEPTVSAYRPGRGVRHTAAGRS